MDASIGRPKNFEEPAHTLITFLDTCVEGATTGWWTTNPELGDDVSIVLVGPKVW